MLKILRYIRDSFWPDNLAIRNERFLLTASALALAAAWPPLPLGFLAFIALIFPLDIVSGRSFGGAFKKGYFFSFIYFLASLYWIGWVHIPGTVAIAAIISLYSSYVFALYAAVYRRKRALAMVLFPFLWIGMEYFRSLFEIAFPWSNLSYTQGSYTPFIQICEFTGDLGISIIVVVVNILLWRAWKNRGARRKALLVGIAGLLIIIPTLYGSVVLSRAEPVDTGTIRISLLQGSIPLKTKWNPDKLDYNVRVYDSLSLAGLPADLLVWPETAVPTYLLADYRLTRFVEQTAMEAGCPILVGTLDYRRLGDTAVETFNAAIQFDPDGRFRTPYHKNKLVPFAETVPYGRYLPFLTNLSLGWSDFVHGKHLQIYKNDFGNYGTLICYEVIFPELVNRYVRNGADFLVNITNDTWYGLSSGPYQHAGMAIFRSIENRIWMARAANSGFSYFVDKYGRIYHESRLFERTIVRGKIEKVKGRTVFNRTGPILGQAGLLLIGLVSCILVIVWVRNRFSG